MATFPRAFRLIFFSVWAVFMTALTYILGAPSLKVLRRRLGRTGYWSLTAAITVGLYFLRVNTHGPQGVLEFKVLAVAFFSLVVLMGVFDEFEEMSFSFVVSSFFTLIINAMIWGGAFALWVSSIGPKWTQVILNSVEAFLKPVADLNPKIQINYFDLMLQLPSIAVIAWMSAIYVAILLESRLNTGDMAARTPLPSLRPQLATLRLPDACVWIFIVSLLGAFGEFQFRAFEVVSVNVMNVCLVLFFFQGIAVVAKFFESLRMGALWQALFMLLIVVQLFLFVSLLGLLDFWLGFRARLNKRAEQINRET